MSWMSWMSINTQDDPQCSWMSWRSWMSWMSINTKGDPWCSWMSIVAQVVLWCTMKFIWRVKITLDVGRCLGWLLMLSDPPCSWKSWMCIDAIVVPWCTNRIVWMHKITLDVAGCLWCLLMNLLCLHEPRELSICSRCSQMSWMCIDAQDNLWRS